MRFDIYNSRSILLEFIFLKIARDETSLHQKALEQIFYVEFLQVAKASNANIHTSYGKQIENKKSIFPIASLATQLKEKRRREANNKMPAFGMFSKLQRFLHVIFHETRSDCVLFFKIRYGISSNRSWNETMLLLTSVK